MRQLKNYLSILSMLIVLSLLTLISCTPDTEKEDLICKVLVEISEGGIGVVSNNEVVSGEEVTLKAVPEETYRFVNWTVRGEEVSKENPYTTIITATTQFKPNFEKDNYVLKVTAGEGGSVKSTSEGEILNGTEVTLTATPNEGYSFVNWTVDGVEVSKENPYTTKITEDVEYKANFISHKITVIAGEGGTAKTSKTQVEDNEEITLTATPNEGYSFVNWTVDGVEVSKENPYITKITENKEFKANFITHKITVIASEGGTAKTSKTQVGHNGQVTLTATPQEGYSFVNWTVDGVEVSTQNPYTTTITEDIEIKANFITHKITVIASEGGTAKTSKTQVGHNGQVTLTATPNEGYSFVNWTVEGKEVSTQNPYTTTITEDIEYKANFKETKGVENGYTWIDLGLPSGIKWATCNVGATTPEGYGDYFAWGETTPKTTYNWSTYKWCNGTYNSLTKYCTNSTWGIVDNKTTLELEDDAAHVNWGGSWRMPTRAEQDELRNTNNCTWRWTSQNGVYGCKVTSKKNGNSIFLPAAGASGLSNLGSADCDGVYWSSSPITGSNNDACYLYFHPSFKGWDADDRCEGLSVRAVCP